MLWRHPVSARRLRAAEDIADQFRMSPESVDAMLAARSIVEGTPNFRVRDAEARESIRTHTLCAFQILREIRKINENDDLSFSLEQVSRRTAKLEAELKGLLLQKPCWINTHTQHIIHHSYHTNLLHEVISAEQWSLVEPLLSAGADPNSVSGNHTPLTRAIEKGHLKSVVALLDAGANLHEQTPAGQTPTTYNPLAMAVLGNTPAIIYELCKRGADIYQPPMMTTHGTFTEGTLLNLTLYNHNLAINRALIACGSNPNQGHHCNDAQILASLNSEQDMYMRTLLQCGADLTGNSMANSLLKVGVVNYQSMGGWNILSTLSMMNLANRHIKETRTTLDNLLDERAASADGTSVAAKMTAEILIASATIGRMDDVFNRHFWQGAEDQLMALLPTLPPWMQEHAPKIQPWIADYEEPPENLSWTSRVASGAAPKRHFSR